ncbi:MAG: LPXTG cell wall anchor domain-containing protein [Cellulomonas sp.]|nr:LPXTG cell wall anchor domain-containing protein [Cellulomonas sp.]MCR6649758.1 LPXTG cell wall anchor domain-containing protein [Cellulomonas sp.]
MPSPVVGELAATGVDTGLVLMTGLYLLLGGLIAWGLHYKKRHEDGAR